MQLDEVLDLLGTDTFTFVRGRSGINIDFDFDVANDLNVEDLLLAIKNQEIFTVPNNYYRNRLLNI